MAEAGNYTCHTNADETKSEVTVDCELLKSFEEFVHSDVNYSFF